MSIRFEKIESNGQLPATPTFVEKAVLFLKREKRLVAAVTAIPVSLAISSYLHTITRSPFFFSQIGMATLVAYKSKEQSKFLVVICIANSLVTSYLKISGAEITRAFINSIFLVVAARIHYAIIEALLRE